MSEQIEPKPRVGEQPVPQTAKPVGAAKKPAPINVDETRDEFIKNAQPVADALRKRGRGEEAAQLEQAAKLIGVAVGTPPQQQQSPPPQLAQGDALKGESVKDVLKNIWDVIDKDPELKKMPQAQALRKSGKALDEAGLLNITIRNGIVVSFVSNFVENFSRAQQVVPASVERKPEVVKESAASAVRAQQPATEQGPATAVMLPQSVEKTAPTLAYTQYAPTPDTGVIETRKVVGNPLDQLNVAITATGQFGINPQVNQERLIGDGMKSVERFFDYQMPAGPHKLAKVGLAEPGQMELTAEGWKVVRKGQLVLTDTAGNVYRPQQLAASVPALATEAAPTTLLVPEALEKAKALYKATHIHNAPAGTGFTKEELPTQLLAKMGVPVEELEKSGQLQKLLSGQKTDLISSFSLRNEQGEAVPFAAKLVLRRDAVGAPSLQFDLPKHQLVIPEQILGKEITPVMKEQLAKHGVVPLADGFRDGKGQSFAAYVAIDKEMNRVVAVRREDIALPKEILGVPLNPQQHTQLLDGRPTPLVALRNEKGQLFDATVVLDPVKQQLTFRDAKPHLVVQQTERVELVAAVRPKIRL